MTNYFRDCEQLKDILRDMECPEDNTCEDLGCPYNYATEPKIEDEDITGLKYLMTPEGKAECNHKPYKVGRPHSEIQQCMYCKQPIQYGWRVVDDLKN